MQVPLLVLFIPLNEDRTKKQKHDPRGALKMYTRIIYGHFDNSTPPPTDEVYPVYSRRRNAHRNPQGHMGCGRLSSPHPLRLRCLCYTYSNHPVSIWCDNRIFALDYWTMPWPLSYPYF